MRPVIGITTYVTPAHYSYWEHETALVPLDYVTAVDRAGGRPLLVPPLSEGADEALDALSGLVLSGGSDIDPELYGDEMHAETFGVQRRRDDAELALLRGALERDMPVLGICRGIQVLNVGLGGDLHQHLPELVGHERHKHDPPGQFVEHDVEIAPHTRLAELMGPRASVMSHHHQGLRRVGEGLVEAGYAEDGSIEAVEAPGKRFALGVLWHAEAGTDLSLFEGLVEEARRYADARRGGSGEGAR
jgi:gamma-glutamyl-gamma-aminobutyrate hydrolase PuuD